MTRSSTFLIAAATLSLSVAAGLTASSFGASARGIDAAGLAGHADARIAGAFAHIGAPVADPLVAAAAQRSRKGDGPSTFGCADSQWPQVSPDCLVAADGSAVRPVRTVTIGYQTGEAGSVLIRMPAPQIASR